MLHTKFQGHRSSGSGEEDFFKVFTIYGHGGHVGHVTQIINYKLCINFHSFSPSSFHILPYTMLHTKFQGHRSSGSGEEDFIRFLPYMGMAAMLVM